MISLREIDPAEVGSRRLIFLVVVLLILDIGIALMTGIVLPGGVTLLEMVLLCLFILLFVPIAFGFTVAATGYWVLRRGGDPLRITNTVDWSAPPPPLPGTAIVMPIFNEDVRRVFAGLRAMYESLQRTGQSDAFDFFVLSDSNDPNFWVEEEEAWLDLCEQVNGFGRIFYRKRRVNIHNKSGNVADFCRRWGARYRYMIVLDADSVMTGPLIVRLARLIEQNPGVGIIQTAPRLARAQTLFGRIQQFAARVYGPLYHVGANFWQLGSGTFWGHNAILRLRPFMQHCAMPEIPKPRRFGGHVLSHDTIEAALMRKAGYGVWFAYDLEGSYEEGPPDLEASLRRDRRWCMGNLQHLGFLFARGLKTASRIHMLAGILAYLCSPLWLAFLLLTSFMVVRQAVAASARPLSHGPPGWGTAALLFLFVMALLLAPKLLAGLLWFQKPDRLEAFGGRTKAALGILGETIFSMILAPVLMLFHSRFVLAALAGSRVRWRPQSRRARKRSGWQKEISAYLGTALVGLAWFAVVARWQPLLLPWLVPVLFGLIVSIPFSRVVGSDETGRSARRRGWFVVPEEIEPVPELAQLEESRSARRPSPIRDGEYAEHHGLLQAILDPYTNAVHVSLLHPREQTHEKTRDYLDSLSDKLLAHGPQGLTPDQRSALLWDADSLLRLHRQLWISPGPELHEWWRRALRLYNEQTARSERRAIDSRL